MRRLVLLAMKKHVNVRLDGRARQQKNVIEMAVREQGVMATLRVLHFGEELFATVGAAKRGYDALNMRNVFRKIPRREGDVAEKGQWSNSCRTSPSVHHCTVAPPTPSAAGQGRRPRESQSGR